MSKKLKEKLDEIRKEGNLKKYILIFSSLLAVVLIIIGIIVYSVNNDKLSKVSIDTADYVSTSMPIGVSKIQLENKNGDIKFSADVTKNSDEPESGKVYVTIQLLDKKDGLINEIELKAFKSLKKNESSYISKILCEESNKLVINNKKVKKIKIVEVTEEDAWYEDKVDEFSTCTSVLSDLISKDMRDRFQERLDFYLSEYPEKDFPEEYNKLIKIQSEAPEKFAAVERAAAEAQRTPEPTAVPTAEPTAEPTAQPTAEPTVKPALEETPNDNSVAADGKKAYTSSNGYTVKYPSTYIKTSMGEAMDFIIADTTTGSNVNIVTTINDGSFDSITKNELESQMAALGMSVKFSEFNRTVINGISAIKYKYNYNGNSVKQIAYIAGSSIFTATYTEFPGTNSTVRNDMESAIASLTVN